jgi:hypothetical protein
MNPPLRSRRLISTILAKTSFKARRRPTNRHSHAISAYQQHHRRSARHRLRIRKAERLHRDYRHDQGAHAPRSRSLERVWEQPRPHHRPHARRRSIRSCALVEINDRRLRRRARNSWHVQYLDRPSASPPPLTLSKLPKPWRPALVRKTKTASSPSAYPPAQLPVRTANPALQTLRMGSRRTTPSP